MRRASPTTLVFFGVFFILLASVADAASFPRSRPARQVIALSEPEHKFVKFVNKVRTERVSVRRKLVKQARSLADSLANHGRLFHRRVTWPHCWGQTIGYGAGPRAVFRAMMRSPPHRSVILDAVYAHVGVGITKRSGVFWVVANFGC